MLFFKLFYKSMKQKEKNKEIRLNRVKLCQIASKSVKLLYNNEIVLYLSK